MVDILTSDTYDAKVSIGKFSSKINSFWNESYEIKGLFK